MDGKNSFGCRVSLLNEHVEVPSSYRNPSYSDSNHSRTSSYASTPCISPQIPPLIRSDSTDSGAMQTPSPITPNFSFEGLSTSHQVSSPVFSTSSSFFQPKEHSYPPVPQNASPQVPYLPNGVVTAPQPHFYRAPGDERQPMPAATTKTKKNQYPCPLAKQYNCPGYFTTSGHAARHAKKHTGKKDAFCPECNKAFTRKDNMEQHRRTHQNGRNSFRNSEASQAKQQTKRPKPAPLQVPVNPVDPRLPASPTSSLGLAPAVQPIDAFNSTFIQQPSFADPYPYALYGAGSRYDLMSPTYAASGLETLAIAASATGEKRKFDG